MRVVSIRPIVFLFILFLLIAGIAAGTATHIAAMSAQSAAYITERQTDSLISPLLLSALKNTIVFCACVLCAIWLPGIVLHSVVTVCKGFLIGFTVCAFIRWSIWLGLLYSFVSVIIPECAALYGFFRLSLCSFSEWRARLKNYFVSKTILPVSSEYRASLRPCFLAMLLSVFFEGMLAPLILRLL